MKGWERVANPSRSRSIRPSLLLLASPGSTTPRVSSRSALPSLSSSSSGSSASPGSALAGSAPTRWMSTLADVSSTGTPSTPTVPRLPRGLRGGGPSTRFSKSPAAQPLGTSQWGGIFGDGLILMYTCVVKYPAHKVRVGGGDIVFSLYTILVLDTTRSFMSSCMVLTYERLGKICAPGMLRLILEPYKGIIL